MATTAAATDRVFVDVADDGTGSLQCRGNDFLPPPFSSSHRHQPSSMPNGTKGASRIIKPSVACRHVFGGGSNSGGGVEANNDNDGDHCNDDHGNDGEGGR